MNGVLAKPFTKDGMYKSVRQHLGHLMKNPPHPPPDPEAPGSAYYVGAGPYINSSATLKFETPTPPSGNAGPGWSPAQLPQPSPIAGGIDQYGHMNGTNPYSMPTSHRPTYSTAMHSADSSSGRVSDVDSPPEKRQRLNPTSNY